MSEITDDNLPSGGSETDDEPPPILRRWSRLYVAILVYLAALLTILTGISHAFHY